MLYHCKHFCTNQVTGTNESLYYGIEYAANFVLVDALFVVEGMTKSYIWILGTVTKNWKNCRLNVF